jgi:hypothetical protein
VTQEPEVAEHGAVRGADDRDAVGADDRSVLSALRSRDGTYTKHGHGWLGIEHHGRHAAGHGHPCGAAVAVLVGRVYHGVASVAAG